MVLLFDPLDSIESFINNTRTFIDKLPSEFATIVEKVDTMSNSFEQRLEQAGVDLESTAISLSEELREVTLDYIRNSLSTTIIAFAVLLSFLIAAAVALIVWAVRKWLRKLL
jgi:hypothetical protein